MAGCWTWRNPVGTLSILMVLLVFWACPVNSKPQPPQNQSDTVVIDYEAQWFKLYNGCPLGQVNQTHGNNTVCCMPKSCSKGYEIEACTMNGTEDTCRLCDLGYIQLTNVSSLDMSRATCFKNTAQHDKCPIYEHFRFAAEKFNSASPYPCECVNEDCYYPDHNAGVCKERRKPCGSNHQLNLDGGCDACPWYAYKHSVGCWPCTINETLLRQGRPDPGYVTPLKVQPVTTESTGAAADKGGGTDTILVVESLPHTSRSTDGSSHVSMPAWILGAVVGAVAVVAFITMIVIVIKLAQCWRTRHPNSSIKEMVESLCRGSSPPVTDRQNSDGSNVVLIQPSTPSSAQPGPFTGQGNSIDNGQSSSGTDGVVRTAYGTEYSRDQSCKSGESVTSAGVNLGHKSIEGRENKLGSMSGTVDKSNGHSTSTDTPNEKRLLSILHSGAGIESERLVQQNVVQNMNPAFNKNDTGLGDGDTGMPGMSDTSNEIETMDEYTCPTNESMDLNAVRYASNANPSANRPLQFQKRSENHKPKQKSDGMRPKVNGNREHDAKYRENDHDTSNNGNQACSPIYITGNTFNNCEINFDSSRLPTIGNNRGLDGNRPQQNRFEDRRRNFDDRRENDFDRSTGSTSLDSDKFESPAFSNTIPGSNTISEGAAARNKFDSEGIQSADARNRFDSTCKSKGIGSRKKLDSDDICDAGACGFSNGVSKLDAATCASDTAKSGLERLASGLNSGDWEDLSESLNSNNDSYKTSLRSDMQSLVQSDIRTRNNDSFTPNIEVVADSGPRCETCIENDQDLLAIRENCLGAEENAVVTEGAAAAMNPPESSKKLNVSNVQKLDCSLTAPDSPLVGVTSPNKPVARIPPLLRSPSPQPSIPSIASYVMIQQSPPVSDVANPNDLFSCPPLSSELANYYNQAGNQLGSQNAAGNREDGIVGNGGYPHNVGTGHNVGTRHNGGNGNDSRLLGEEMMEELKGCEEQQRADNAHYQGAGNSVDRSEFYALGEEMFDSNAIGGMNRYNNVAMQQESCYRGELQPSDFSESSINNGVNAIAPFTQHSRDQQRQSQVLGQSRGQRLGPEGESRRADVVQERGSNLGSSSDTDPHLTDRKVVYCGADSDLEATDLKQVVPVDNQNVVDMDNNVGDSRNNVIDSAEDRNLEGDDDDEAVKTQDKQL